MQTLAYLGSLMRAETISNAVIICPKSVVRSWEREANLILKNMCVPKATVSAVTSDMVDRAQCDRRSLAPEPILLFFFNTKNNHGGRRRRLGQIPGR